MSRTMVIEPGKASYEILKYIQNNPDKVKKISAHRLAELISAQDDNSYGEVTLAQVISKLVKKRVIYRSDADKYYDFRINYWHELIPEDILANAPVEVKRLMAKKIDDMEPGQYMDEEGCITTPNAVEKTEDPFNEDKTVEDNEEDVHENEETVESEPGTFENPIVREKYPWEEESTTIPLQITKKKDGKTTNVTINLTINI